MMRYSLAFSALIASAAPALPQSFPEWIVADGRLAAGYTDRVPGADAFLVGDTTLRFAPAFAGRFGAELGVYGRADALDTPHETYGTLTFDIAGGGRISAGVPRPAYDSFAVSALEIWFPSLAIDRTGATRSAATQGAMFGNWLPYGVSFSNQTNALRYAVSVLDASNVGRTVASIGAATEIGDWQLSGAVEIAWGGSTEISGKVQAIGNFGPVTGGLGYYAPGAAGGRDLAEVFAGLTPWDRLTLSAVVQVPLDGTAATGGIAARYGITDSVAISAGVASDAGSGAVFNAFLDWRF